MSIEAMASAQAIDFLAPLKTSPRGQAAHSAIREVCPTMNKDRVMYPDFARIAKVIESGKISAALTKSYSSPLRSEPNLLARSARQMQSRDFALSPSTL